MKIALLYCDPIWQVIAMLVFLTMREAHRSCWALLRFSPQSPASCYKILWPFSPPSWCCFLFSFQESQKEWRVSLQPTVRLGSPRLPADIQSWKSSLVYKWMSQMALTRHLHLTKRLFSLCKAGSWALPIPRPTLWLVLFITRRQGFSPRSHLWRLFKVQMQTVVGCLRF